MSEVISFRLNPNNPREALALEILRAKNKEGFSRRRVLTDALIDLGMDRGQSPSLSINEINAALEHVSALLERINGDDQDHSLPEHSQVQVLNDNFLNSIKVAAKPGLKLE